MQALKKLFISTVSIILTIIGVQYYSQTYYTSVPSNILQIATKVNNQLRAQGHNKQNIVTIVDFTQPSTSKRLWVIDMNTHQVLINTWVSHGKNSGGLFATKFSNVVGSNKSSIGVSLTAETYQGKHGLSRRLKGIDSGYNTNIYKRAVVIHGANYVGEGKAGRSLGCPAVPMNVKDKLIKTVGYDSVFIMYYPSPLWNKYT